MQPSVAIVVIGRNEGARLRACLARLPDAPVVYVDSGSTDGSAEWADEQGASVVRLDPAQPFTAARARNAGVAALEPRPDAVMFVDGDCTLAPGFLPAALDALATGTDRAVIVGRLREREPEASIYNRLADIEWDTPLGDLRACGGIALMRVAAFEQVGGFDPRVIAGEEPELCVRLRAAGWRITRIDVDMAEHDAAMTRFGQYLARARRAGYAYAQGAALHGAPPERHHVPELRRALVWGAVLPAAILLGAFFTPLAWLGLALYPLQIARLALRYADPFRATLVTLSKFAEALGVAAFLRDRVSGRTARRARPARDK